MTDLTPHPFTGRCNCGAVSATIDAPPLWVRQCWCAQCQRIACGNATVNASFPVEHIHLEGELAWSPNTAASGNVVEHGFCAKCGTQVMSRNSGRLQARTVRVGFLDQSDALVPDSAIWLEEAPEWVRVPEGMEGFPRQP
ncbi:GFA family protein [Novosphingobium sp. 9]|uniref:GFA family protein n=1 Tax=Novosphingobium sp. 9 TaxID=2025349 RepID=UPI0021B5F695|nr:GFA family protein [Novosphingobium sp. 9]